MDVSVWATAAIGTLTAIIGAMAGPSIPLIAQRFQPNQKAREALSIELQILADIDASRESFASRDQLAELIERRLAQYLGRDHTGAQVTPKTQ